MASSKRISPGTRRSSSGLFTRRPGDFLLGGGLWNEVGIDQENISRYQENISRSIHRETRRISPGGGGLEMKLTLTNRIHPGTRRTSHGLFTRRPGDFLLVRGGEGWGMKLIFTGRIYFGTRRTSPGLFTRRPGDFLLEGGGLGKEVDIYQENISRYQEKS